MSWDLGLQLSQCIGQRETEPRAAAEEGLLVSKEQVFQPFSITSLDIRASDVPISRKSKKHFGYAFIFSGYLDQSYSFSTMNVLHLKEACSEALTDVMPVYASQNSPETNQGFLHYLFLPKCPLTEKSLG